MHSRILWSVDDQQRLVCRIHGACLRCRYDRQLDTYHLLDISTQLFGQTRYRVRRIICDHNGRVDRIAVHKGDQCVLFLAGYVKRSFVTDRRRTPGEYDQQAPEKYRVGPENCASRFFFHCLFQQKFGATVHQIPLVFFLFRKSEGLLRTRKGCV